MSTVFENILSWCKKRNKGICLKGEFTIYYVYIAAPFVHNKDMKWELLARSLILIKNVKSFNLEDFSWRFENLTILKKERDRAMLSFPYKHETRSVRWTLGLTAKPRAQSRQFHKSKHIHRQMFKIETRYRQIFDFWRWKPPIWQPCMKAPLNWPLLNLPLKYLNSKSNTSSRLK